MELSNRERDLYNSLLRVPGLPRFLMSGSEIYQAEKLVRRGIILKGRLDERGRGTVVYYIDRGLDNET